VPCHLKRKMPTIRKKEGEQGQKEKLVFKAGLVGGSLKQDL
jgi:hypothetical protein